MRATHQPAGYSEDKPTPVGSEPSAPGRSVPLPLRVLYPTLSVHPAQTRSVRQTQGLTLKHSNSQVRAAFNHDQPLEPREPCWDDGEGLPTAQ